MTAAKPSLWFRSVAAATALACIAACSSSTVISSNPTGARLFLNGEFVGTTPYTMTDTKIVGSQTLVRLEYPGYDPLNSVVIRNEEFDVGACIGGFLVLVPFLWIMGYKPTHHFELRPFGSSYPPPGAYPPGYAPPPGYPAQPYPPQGAPPPGYPPAQPAPAPAQPAPPPAAPRS